MARGFESKDVEYQQAEAARDRTPRRSISAADRAAASRLATLELARSRAKADLAAARSAAHRRMLEHAIDALDRQIAAVGAHAE
jgi:hypothetical protein